MASDPDRYDDGYAEKLWRLLPAIYRAEDAPDLDQRGPLEELVRRIGTQAAVVRRSVDRLWEDQSIETCDDWVIDYLGDLLATNLVASLDARGRRLDVAKTVYYRQRKGTVGLLEELATDITGWGVRVVEMFHRLGRTRHGLDPAIGLPAKPDDPRGQLQRAQGLVGARTRTGAGGLADLRDVHGAALSGTAFDELFHTADVRRGRGMTGWHDIPRLGVFVWRLRSLAVEQVTSIADATCANQLTFDPTGRDVPLFAAGDRPIGDHWVSPAAHQMPGPLTADLIRVALTELYRPATARPPGQPDDRRSLSVYRVFAGRSELIPVTDLASDPRDPAGRPWIDAERGRLVWPAAATGETFLVDYHHGFSAEIGAGGYDRLLPDPSAAAVPADEQPGDPPAPIDVAGGGTALAGFAPSIGTAAIHDSLTYNGVSDLTAIEHVVLAADNLRRPLIRLPIPVIPPAIPPAVIAWTFTGASAAAVLVLDGLHVCGGNLVLRGTFDRVVLSCCTLDPGTWNPAAMIPTWATAADGRTLAATELRIEGSIRRLVLDRCITGPIVAAPLATAAGVERLIIRDSIVQAAAPGARALSLPGGELAVSRTTVLGPAHIHRLDASECVLADSATVDDCQHGCVRFSAYQAGSTLPRTYESVPVVPGTMLFTSRDFGRPGYAQLLATAGAAIAEGAKDGSEMGAFWRERNAVKERSLLIKYQEYLPLGLEPVVVHMT